MNTDYNTIKYNNYPNSNDGLFNYDFDEQNIADYILVDKKEVTLIKTKE